MRKLCCLSVFVAACTPQPPQFARGLDPFKPELARGPSAEQPGRVVVLTNTCSSIEGVCPRGWSDTIDNIVSSGLDFHGYATVDPARLHAETVHREDLSSSSNDKEDHVHDGNTVSDGGGFIGIIPVLGGSEETSHSHDVTVHVKNERTIQLEGAQYDDLKIEDQQRVLALVDASSIVTTKLIVSSGQTAELMIKLSSARDGSMIWSARCAAQGGPIEASIEHAARCAVSAIVP